MDETKTTEELRAEIAEQKRKIDILDAQIKAQQEKSNRIARQILQIAKENDMSIADMEQVFTTIKAFERVHARMVFDPEVFDVWSSPKDMFSMCMSSFDKGMQILD